MRFRVLTFSANFGFEDPGSSVAKRLLPYPDSATEGGMPHLPTYSSSFAASDALQILLPVVRVELVLLPVWAFSPSSEVGI